MSLAKITLIGFYNAYEDSDPIFADLTLPAGIDKDLFINSLLLDAGEFEVLYADPDFFKNAITIWGQKWYRTFQKWQEALSVNYDPLNNYDRTERWTTKTDSTSDSTADATTNTNRSSFDSASLTPYTSIKDDSTGRNVFDGTEVRTGRAYGNIGVTTSQQMLEAELNLQEWNLYQHMIDLFKTELLIPIY